MIWPDDLLWDRQGCAGGEDGCRERRALLGWLDSGAGEAARAQVRVLAQRELWSPRDEDVRVLYDDATGRIVGSPQRSHGYCYIAAWRHEDVPGNLCKHCGHYHDRVPEDLCEVARAEYAQAGEFARELGLLPEDVTI